jgi:hypothetical protein
MVAYTIANLAANKVNVGTSASHHDNASKMYRMEVDLDFVAITAQRSADGLTALATSDTLQILNIPAKTLVMAVGIDVTTADGTASTVDIGHTGGDVDGYINGHDCNAVGSACSVNNTLVEGTPNLFEPALGNGNYYGAADTIDMLFITAPQDASVMRVWAVCIDCS